MRLVSRCTQNEWCIDNGDHHRSLAKVVSGIGYSNPEGIDSFV